VIYRVTAGHDYVKSGELAARIGADGWVPVPLHFVASPGREYTAVVKLEDVHGFRVVRTLRLVGARPAG
jgi:hypothetical protein